MPRPTLTRLSAATLTLAACVSLTACGSDKKPAGPDVRGLNLSDAENSLKKANVGYTEHARDAAFGILVKSNFTVCAEHYVAKHMVRLDVAKHGC